MSKGWPVTTLGSGVHKSAITSGDKDKLTISAVLVSVFVSIRGLEGFARVSQHKSSGVGL